LASKLAVARAAQPPPPCAAARGNGVSQEAHTGVSREAGGSPPLYANFPRRLKALSLDSVVLIGFSTLVFVLVLFLEHLDAARMALVISWWFVLLFYEPLLVWRLGGTVGHLGMNLHVVDNRTEGKISLPKALMRFWVKALLGIFSFLTMNLSRRHQAMHDIFTNSSVRIRKAAKARPVHYTLGRP
jgi:uncharacterized RDD family membrane protein YckC